MKKILDKALIKDMLGGGFCDKRQKRDAIFSNAIARFNETKLLKKEQFLRLSSATDHNEAIKMLFDYGYTRGENDIDRLIDTQINALNSYAYEESFSDRMLKVMLNPFYYNNAKVYYKSLQIDVEPDQNALFQLQDEHIKTAIYTKNYENLDFFMRQCILVLDANEQKNGKDIDVAFTKAMFADSLMRAKSSLKKELISLVKAQIDVNNFITFMRSRRLNRDWDFCDQMLLDGGKIKKQSLEQFFHASDSEIIDEFHFCGYEFLSKAAEGKMNLDLSLDAEIIKSSFINSLSYSSLSPFLSYYFRQLTEYKVVRMILTLLKNGLREEIDRRIKGLFD